MKKTFFFTSATLILIAIIYFFATQRALAPTVIKDTPEDLQVDVPVPKLSPEMANTATEMIEVTSPLPNATITNSMILTGRARGPWYFEASFPIELRDANNVLITTVVAQAQ